MKLYIRELCIFNNRRLSIHRFTYIMNGYTTEWKIVTYYYSEIIFIRLRFQLISVIWVNESMGSTEHAICAMVIIRVTWAGQHFCSAERRDELKSINPSLRVFDVGKMTISY